MADSGTVTVMQASDGEKEVVTSDKEDPASSSQQGTSKEKNKKDHQCEECGRMFQSKGSLIRHGRIHSEYRPFDCPEEGCTKSFPWRENLMKHLRVTHGEKKYVCHHCEQSYGSSSALKRHERIHSQQKRFECEECGEKFDLSETYKIHLRNHSGILPFECSICGEQFSSRSVCRRHSKSHGQQLQ